LPEAVCGNDQLEPGEECDDGNTLPNDGCSPSCQWEELVCGDGILSPGEECDDGNIQSGDGCSASCEDEDVQPGDIIITEIMKNPTGPDTPGEWFEVHSKATWTIDLNGWQIVDTYSDAQPHDIDSLTPLEIEPGGYLVFALNDDQDTNGGVEVDYVYPQEITLANSAPDGLALIEDAEADIIIDEVDFNPDDYPNEQGRSLSLHPAALDHLENDDPANWCSAKDSDLLPGGDYGTPGAVNSSCTGSVCGDGAVDEGEECDPGDPAGDACCNPGTCQFEAPCCGNLICEEPGENCESCEHDCDPCPCVPSCANAGCKDDDGCGEPCGCPVDQECCDDGSCQDDCDCEADCAGKDCGDDGCGGSCGTCEDALVCLDGKCSFDCSDSQCQPGDKGCTEDGTAVWVCEDSGDGCGVKVEKKCAEGWVCVAGVCAGIEEVVTAEPEADVWTVPDSVAGDAAMADAAEVTPDVRADDFGTSKDAMDQPDIQVLEGVSETLGDSTQYVDAGIQIEEAEKGGAGCSGCTTEGGGALPPAASLVLLLAVALLGWLKRGRHGHKARQRMNRS